MNRFENITGGTISYSTRLLNNGNQLTGYKPLMWLMALLLAAVVAGCGGHDGVPSSSPPSSGSTVLPGVAGTTGANATNPTVISASPANLATNVATSTNSWDTTTTSNVVTGTLVTATFNAAMDPATITAAGTFTLKTTTAGTNVPGTVTMNAAHTIATFTPTATALTANTKYTATVTTAAKNAGHTAMPKAVAWSFTTNATVLTAQAPVNLLTAGDFAILANTAVTYNGSASVPAVTGDVGISPGLSAAITGFANYAVDSSVDFATADEVAAPGKIYAPDFTGGQSNSNGLTPAKMTAAQNDMVTAYTDAAGRTPGVGATNLNLGAGTLTGLTLLPGTYTWDAGTPGGNVNITGDITLTGTATDVWIFQVSGALTQSSATNIILGGTAKAKNIFWQVAGGVTLGTTAHMEGVIMSATAITLNAGATANGRLLAQSAATLGGTVTQPAP